MDINEMDYTFINVVCVGAEKVVWCWCDVTTVAAYFDV